MFSIWDPKLVGFVPVFAGVPFSVYLGRCFFSKKSHELSIGLAQTSPKWASLLSPFLAKDQLTRGEPEFLKSNLCLGYCFLCFYCGGPKIFVRLLGIGGFYYEISLPKISCLPHLFFGACPQCSQPPRKQRQRQSRLRTFNVHHLEKTTPPGKKKKTSIMCLQKMGGVPSV